MRELRDDQNDAIDFLRGSIAGGHRRVVMQAPTGFGKTVLAAQLVANARDKGKRVIFTVPALSLVDQTVERFGEHGIRDVGVIQADHILTDWSKPVQIASVQTLQRRKRIPDADLVLIDEVHKWFKFYNKWLDDPAWENVPFIGLSATPWTKGLGKYFTGFVRATTTQKLIDAGRLSPFRVFAPTHPDLSGVHTVAGDYHEGELSEVMAQKFLVADIVQTWLEKGQWRPTLCFAVDRKHAHALEEQFKAAGVPTAYQDAYTTDDERREIRKGFHNGTIKVVVNIGTLTTGVDWDVRCIIVARPTKSEMLFVQIIGRGLRTADGKDDLLVLDHSDNHLRLGFVTDIDASHTQLDDGKPKSEVTGQDKTKLPRECPVCSYLKPPHMLKCPNCGHSAAEKREKREGVEVKDGHLEELKAPQASMAEKIAFLAELKRYERDKGYKPGWAANKYREKHKVWPANSMNDIPPAAEISPSTASWIKSRQIAWAHSKGRRFGGGFKKAA